MRMDERSSKRARQQRDVGGMGLPAVDDGFGTAFSRASLVGCHLQVKPSQTHLFFGSAIELKVSLLNDEDVVQQMTQGINVSITTEDGKVVGPHPRMLETTPKHPALLDGTSTFQLLLWEGCVRAGTRIKVHVEGFPGRAGDQIKAYSEPIMVCRSALTVASQPPEHWYKDEGGKNNCISIDVMVREKAAGKAGQVQPGVPLTLALVYENGTEVHSQDILQVQSDTQLVTNEHGRAHLKFKITEVSQRHQSQRFCIKICPDIRMSPECSDVAPVVTVPVMVLSKRKNRRLKAEKQALAQSAAAYVQSGGGGGGGMADMNMANAQSAGLRSLMWATAGVTGQLSQSPPLDQAAPLSSPPWGSPASSSILNGTPGGRGGGGGRMGPAALAPHQQQHSSPPPPTGAAAAATARATGPAGGGGSGGSGPLSAARVSAPVEDVPFRVPGGATGALSKVFSWTNAVLQLLQMELQWEHVGYEHIEHNGRISADYARPLFRCPVCRLCKGTHQPHQKHAADCKLRGLLDEFAGRTSKDFAEAVREQQQSQRGGGRASPSPPAAAGGRGGTMAEATGGGRGGGGAGVLKEEAFRGFGGGDANGAAMRMAELARGPVSAITGLKSSDGSAPGEAGLIADSVSGRRGEDANVVTAASSLRGPSGHFLPGMHSHELLARGGSGGMSRGLSIGLSGMFDNNMTGGDASGTGRGGDKEGLARSGSVAPFVPQRSNLTPAEEKAHFIMLPSASPSPTGAADGGGGGKHLTVFSEKGILLGFYEEKYDVGQQTHFPFQGFENNFSASAKGSLEVRLQAALEDESGGPAHPKKRDTGEGTTTTTTGRPTRSSVAAVAEAALAVAEAEAAAAAADAKKESLGGYRKVYKLADFKGYQEMKEQVLNDWCLGQKMDMSVFESETADAKTQAKNSSR